MRIALPWIQVLRASFIRRGQREEEGKETGLLLGRKWKEHIYRGTY